MHQQSILFPAPVLPPEGCDLNIGENPEPELEAWLAILPSGGPGYFLSPDSCDRNLDPDNEESADRDLLALIPPNPNDEATLGIDFQFLDRAMNRAWSSVEEPEGASPTTSEAAS